jgi:hypothetical protein
MNITVAKLGIEIRPLVSSKGSLKTSLFSKIKSIPSYSSVAVIQVCGNLVRGLDLCQKLGLCKSVLVLQLRWKARGLHWSTNR